MKNKQIKILTLIIILLLIMCLYFFYRVGINIYSEKYCHLVIGGGGKYMCSGYHYIMYKMVPVLYMLFCWSVIGLTFKQYIYKKKIQKTYFGIMAILFIFIVGIFLYYFFTYDMGYISDTFTGGL